MWGLNYAGVPLAGYAHRAEFGGGIVFCRTGYCWKLLYVLVLVRLPSLHDNYASVVSWNNGALQRNCRRIHSKTSFSPVRSFLLCRNSLYRFRCVILWSLWVGRARHPGPGSFGVSVELFNVGGWLTHGDFAHESSADFLAVAEHRLIPARVRGEWSWLRRSAVSSIWAPACQETSHVGNAGAGVVSSKGAPLSLPSFATAQFQRFFDCGRAVWCLLPLGRNRFLNLVVLCGYQGADADAEQLALTVQLFDSAFAELAVVARGSPCLLAGDFNVEPTKIPCLSKGISAGLWVDLDAAWSAAQGRQPAVSCMRSWDSSSGSRRDFLVGCPLATAALFSCSVSSCWWLQPHFAVSAVFDCDRWSSQVTQPIRCSPLWPASWLPALDKSRGSKSVEVQRV